MKRTLLAQTLAAILGTVGLSGVVFANHPVLVEGESDSDGDGLLRVDEDNDGDRVYGTLSAALGANLGAINNNGKITIVTSGRFPESLLVTGANGNVTIEGAPGVDANIDAVIAGSPASTGNVVRQGMPGIVVSSDDNRSIILRNLTIRNWSEGVVVEGNSHVLLDNVRVEQNFNYGIQAAGRGVHVAITNSQVVGTGFRVGAAGNSPDVDAPAPGTGISFEDGARGLISNSASIRNFGPGLSKRGASVKRVGFVSFDNGRRGRHGHDDD